MSALHQGRNDSQRFVDTVARFAGLSMSVLLYVHSAISASGDVDYKAHGLAGLVWLSALDLDGVHNILGMVDECIVIGAYAGFLLAS